MTWLIDTNARSEFKKRKPHPGVARWFEIQPSTGLYLSVLTLGELRKGIYAVPEGERKARFSAWLNSDIASNTSHH